MIEVTLYSRTDCHLCEVARDDLRALQSVVPHRVQVVDVDSTEELRRTYGFEVPVIKVGPYTLRAPIARQDLEVTLRAADHGLRQTVEVERAWESGQLSLPVEWNSSDRLSEWLSKHYIGFFNTIILIYIFLPFLAPALMSVGLDGPAALIYRGYSAMCHQLAFRSWFLFGEQAAYPRLPGSADLSFTQVTGISADDLWAARAYVGSAEVGYKVALCERDVAIYLGILAFGVVFALSKHRLPGLPWYLWLVFGVLPIGLDGVSQLISQPPISLIPYRESSALLRSLTGGLFGVMSCWFIYPYVEGSMQETRDYLERKRRQIHNQEKRLQRIARGQTGE